MFWIKSRDGFRRTLYVSRPVVNAIDLNDWFKAQGLGAVVAPEEMHVTVAYSKGRVDWGDIGMSTPRVDVYPSMRRQITPLGDKGALVLKIASEELTARWQHILDQGATWDYEGYQPHITITYEPVLNPQHFYPYPGSLILGPELFTELQSDWSSNVSYV